MYRFQSKSQWVSTLIYTLNLLDLLFTLYALHLGATELNPFMQCIPLQIFYKVFVVGFILRWLSKQDTKISRVGLRACMIVYGALDLYHVGMLALIKIG